MELVGDEDFAVIEMGASGPNEMSYLKSIAKPQVVLVNNAMAAHLEGFGSLQGVADAKGEIYQDLQANNVAVINRDDRFYHSGIKRLRMLGGADVQCSVARS